MLQLVFRLPFDGRLSRPSVQELASRIGLTVNRTDDWDTQVGFRLIGDTGAIRLFRLDNTDQEEANGAKSMYEFHGIATDREDGKKVSGLFATCVEAVSFIEGNIDEEHVIEPPGVRLPHRADQ